MDQYRRFKGDKDYNSDGEKEHHSISKESKSYKDEFCDNYRQVKRQETKQTFSTPRRDLISEPVQKERKRWVRPPIVGQAGSDNTLSMQEDSPLETANSTVVDKLQYSNDGEMPSHWLGEISKSLKTEKVDQDKLKELRMCGNKLHFNTQPAYNIEHQGYPSSCPSQDSDSCGVDVTGARPPSPASVSSVTSSRRLEWDSGADVGYQAHLPARSKTTTDGGLSTLERIVLAQGYSAALRLEPEGLAGSAQPTSQSQTNNFSNSNYGFNTPTASSTPLVAENGNIIGTRSDIEQDIMPVVKIKSKRDFFSSKESADMFFTSEEDADNENYSENSNTEGEVARIVPKKVSTSLTDLSECDMYKDEKKSNSIPRSHSHVSLAQEENGSHTRKLYITNTFSLKSKQKKGNGVTTCSASSSSIATVVPKLYESPRMSDKLIQTSVFNMFGTNSVGIQVSGFNSVSENSDLHIASENISPTISGNVANKNNNNKQSQVSENNIAEQRLHTGLESHASKKNGKRSCEVEIPYSNRNLQVGVQLVDSNRHDIETASGTLDSITTSSGTTGSWGMENLIHQVNASSQVASRRDSSGVVGSANSFEYLPGDVYENNAVSCNSTNKHEAVEDLSSQSESLHRLTREDKLKTARDIVWNESVTNSLKRDIESCVVLLKNHISSKSYTSSLKRNLVRQIVKRIVETDYAEEDGVGLAGWSSPVSKLDLNSNSSLSGYNSLKITNGETRQKMESKEAPEISRECKQVSKEAEKSSQTYFIAHKCVGTALSGVSGSSCSGTSEAVSCSTSRAGTETTKSTTTGYSADSSTAHTNNFTGWRDYTTQSEKEYEQYRQKSNVVPVHRSVLLNICDAERENQLSWICMEIRHLNALKQLLEKQKKLAQSSSLKSKESKREVEKRMSTSRHKRRNVAASTRSETRVPSEVNSNLHSDVNSLEETNTYKKQSMPASKADSPRDVHTPTNVDELNSNHSNNEVGCKNVESILTSDTESKASRLSRNTLSHLKKDVGIQTAGSKSSNIRKEEIIRKPLSSNICNTASSFESEGNSTLCCCECKKMLENVKSDLKFGKHKNSKDNLTVKQTARKNSSKKTVDDGAVDLAGFNHSCTSANSERTPPLSFDSTKGKSKKFDTVKSIKSWEDINRRRGDGIETVKRNKCICPCCGSSEEEAEQLDGNAFMCAKCMEKVHKPQVRKCATCGAQESEKDNSSYSDSVTENNKSDKHLEPNKGQGNFSENVSNSEADDQRYSGRSPLGYILTLDTLKKKPKRNCWIQAPIVRTRDHDSIRNNVFILKSRSSRKDNIKENIETVIKTAESPSETRKLQYNLQEWLIANRPDFIRNAEYRRQCLDDIAHLRELRQKSKLTLLALANSGDIDRQRIPPPPLAVKRVFSQHTMRAQTEQKYYRLPEVLNKKAEKKKKEDYRTNRLMAEIFAKKLQKKVLKGEINLSNSRSVISSL